MGLGVASAPAWAICVSEIRLEQHLKILAARRIILGLLTLTGQAPLAQA